MRSIALILLLITSFARAQEHRDLTENWMFRMEGEQKWNTATVPGTVHQDLMENRLIDDVFYENNEQKYRWVEEKNWEYRTTFSVNDFTFNYAVHALVFEGLDTYAEVYLNGTKVLFADNMFRTWRVEVQDHLQVGENELKVKFLSPVMLNKEKVKSAPYELPAGCEETDIKVSPYTRKAAYHFGWDWAPRVVTCGIWKNVYLESSRGARIESVNVVTEEIRNDSAFMRYDFELDLSDNAYIQFLGIRFQGLSYQLDLGRNERTFSIRKAIRKPELWWPNGHGDQKLYTDSVELMVNYKTRATKTFRYGIRQIELINEPDSIGTSFYFKVNGKPIFIKGANYVPQDVLLPRVTDKQYRDLLTKAKNANMNMLRVWGGGVYEKDIFYDLCDELGLLVWQDFMFAGSLYPADSAFLTNVRKEAQNQVKRLRVHPSIAIWCGNNEIEVAWHNWGWQEKFGYTKKQEKEIWNNYLTLFDELLQNEINDLDPSRAYTRSTPISNWGTEENFNHATMHYWGVWHGKEPFENYRDNVGRFMVEYGFQSFPDVSTLSKVMEDSSLNLNSAAMKNRQKSYIGNGLIQKHIEQYYPPPADFEQFVQRSQQTQAIALETAIQAHRFDGHCMGTLFWQLNDCWPGPSWSVIDYYGNEKEAYKTVKTNFQPFFSQRDGATVHIFSDSDQWKMDEMTVTVTKKNGKEKAFIFPYTIMPFSSTKMDLSDEKQVLKAIEKGWELDIVLGD